MAILNLQPLTPKTPEEELLESIQGLDIQRPTPDVPRFRGYGDFLAQRGGFAPEDLRTREELMGMTQAEVDEYQRQRRQARRAGIGETLLRVGQAFQGLDATALAMQREQNRRLIEQQEELKKAQEGFFKDPKYKNLAKIYGMEFAFEQRQADVQAEAQAQANQKFMDAVKGTPYENIANTVGVVEAKKAYVERELKPQTVPADIQKLNQLAILREKLNPQSTSYDKNYTEKQFQQDASILGVSSNLFSGSKTDFIEDYMRQMRAMKSLTGEPLYTDEELKTMAESAYELIYPPITEEEDLSAAFNEMIQSATALTSE